MEPTRLCLACSAPRCVSFGKAAATRRHRLCTAAPGALLLGNSTELPINNETTRAVILAALECIDAIVLFDEDTPYDLIKFVQPDILVKGDDYKAEEIVGYDIVTAKGGKVITIPLVKGFSTTNLIAKLKG